MSATASRTCTSSENPSTASRSFAATIGSARSPSHNDTSPLDSSSRYGLIEPDSSASTYAGSSTPLVSDIFDPLLRDCSSCGAWDSLPVAVPLVRNRASHISHLDVERERRPFRHPAGLQLP